MISTLPRVFGVPVLDSPWPVDVDPAAVPFKVRTETVLRRAGYYDDPSRFDTLTEADVLAWWNAGDTTVADIRIAGNRAIRLHHEAIDRHSEMNITLAAVAAEPWARHIWHRDPRFTDHLPEVDMTIHDIAASGLPDVRRSLWTRLDSLRTSVAAQAALSLSEAIADYVEAISGQFLSNSSVGDTATRAFALSLIDSSRTLLLVIGGLAVVRVDHRNVIVLDQFYVADVVHYERETTASALGLGAGARGVLYVPDA